MNVQQKPRRRTQEERRVESEQKLINALVSVINTDGINAVTCDSVSEAAGCSRSLVTLRLGKRDEMFMRLIEHLQARRWKQLQLVSGRQSTMRGKLQSMIDLHFDGLRDDAGYKAYMVLLAGSLADRPFLQRMIAQGHDTLRTWVVGVLRQGAETGEFACDLDIEFAATRVGAFLLGSALYFQIYTGQPDALDKLRQDGYDRLPPSIS